MNSFKLLSTQLISDWKSGPVSVFTLKSLGLRLRPVLKFPGISKNWTETAKDWFCGLLWTFCGLNPSSYTRYVTNNIFYYYNYYFHILVKALECSCTSNSPNQYIRLHHLWSFYIWIKSHTDAHLCLPTVAWINKYKHTIILHSSWNIWQTNIPGPLHIK